MDLFYDRGLKKWRSVDMETGELGGVVRDKESYFIVNIESYRRLGGIIGIGGLGFFGMLISFMEYKNRVSVSYRRLVTEFGLSSATIKKHLGVLLRHNVIIEKVSERGSRYYLVNGEYVFRGNGRQMEENRKLFRENGDMLKRDLLKK